MRRQLAGLIGLAALAACSSATDPNVSAQITVAASKNIVSKDAPAVITTKVLNTGSHSINLDTSPCGGSRFIVRSASGTEIVPMTEACSAIKAGKTLKPGEEYSFVSTWNGANASGHVVDGEYDVIGTPFGPTGPRTAAARVIVRGTAN